VSIKRGRHQKIKAMKVIYKKTLSILMFMGGVFMANSQNMDSLPQAQRDSFPTGKDRFFPKELHFPRKMTVFFPKEFHFPRKMTVFSKRDSFPTENDCFFPKEFHFPRKMTVFSKKVSFPLEKTIL
jgi:hypothetical protein